VAGDPFFFLQRGKADTLCRKKSGSPACEAAPERVFGAPKTSHGASKVEA
jgi:hypothetical protein